jgi:hypothetical protein
MAIAATGGVTLAQEGLDIQSDAVSLGDAESQDPQDLPPPRPEPNNERDDSATADDKPSGGQRTERHSEEDSVLTDREEMDEDEDDESDSSEIELESRFERRDRRRDARLQDSRIRFGASTDRGLEIASLARSGVFYRGGLRQGDVLVSIHGQPVQSQSEFIRLVSRFAGQRIPLVVLRDGREETVYIVYDRQDRGTQRDLDDESSSASPYLGVTFEPGARGLVMIGSVAPNSPAEQAGLQIGDILLSLNDREVSSPYDVIETVAALEPGDSLDIEFSRRVAKNTQAVIVGRPSGQARRGNPGTVRRTDYLEDDQTPRTAREIEDDDVGFRDFGDRRILRSSDQDDDGRAIDRDRRLLPRRRN